MDENIKDTNSGKQLIILGVIPLREVADKLAAMRHTYQKKTLSSNSDNWRAIVKNIQQLKNEDKLLGVVLLVQPRLLSFCAKPEYHEVWRSLWAEIQLVPSLVFVSNTYLSGAEFRSERRLFEKSLSMFTQYSYAGSSAKEVLMRAIIGSSDETIRRVEQLLKRIDEAEGILKYISEDRADFIPFKYRSEVQARLLHFLDEVG